MDRREALSTAALGAPLVFALATVALPQVTYPQVAVHDGPELPYGNSTYAISAYYIPTVPEGVPISVQISGYLPGTVVLSFFPSAQSVVNPTGSPDIQFDRPLGSTSNDTIVSPASQAYGIYVVSYNGTGFRLAVSSVWSPFYVVRIYTFPAMFAVIVTALMVYYFHEVGDRRRAEREVMKSLAAGRKGDSGSRA